MNGALPTGWAETRLGTVAASMKNGLYRPASVYAHDGIACLRMYNIDRGSLVWKDIKRMRLNPSEVAEYQLLAGDLLINRVNSRELVGKAALIPSDIEPCVFESKNIRLRINNDAAYSAFVNFALLLDGQNYFSQNTQQVVGMASISQPQVAGFPLRLPPLAEQRRIVEQIEALLAKVQSSQERLAIIPALLKRFRHSVLAAACTGKLTADWRKVKRGKPIVAVNRWETLRKQKVDDANAKAGRSRFRHTPAALIDIGDRTKGIDELFELPETWTWASLGQLTWAVSDGPHFSPRYVPLGQGVPFISGRNISYEGIDFSDAKYVSPEDHAEFTKRTHPEIGDVLLTKGGTTGIATVVTTKREFSVWVHVAVLKVVDQLVNPFYLRDALSTPFAYIQSQAQTHGVGNQDLGLTRMVHIAVPLPPLEEQLEIVKRVGHAFAVADRIEARYKKARALADKLTDSILAKAFRGELVPTEAELARRQGRTYESAEDLLQRIKQLQSAQPTPSRTRKKPA